MHPLSPSHLFDLSGQVAVLIGGTGELCGAMAEGLAAAGAEVVLVGRSEDKAKARLARIEEAGGRGYFLAAEATERPALEAVLAEVLARSGRLDILVNGAGTNSATPFLAITEEEFERIWRVNFLALALACQVFGQHFLTAGRGCILNIGSLSGLNPLSRVFTYSATKAAVHNLTRNLAREWAPQGIRVNTLVPGFFPAEQNRKVLTPERVESILRHTPMGRFGEARELIGATLLLTSAAGAFITGTELVVDGGFSALSI